MDFTYAELNQLKLGLAALIRLESSRGGNRDFYLEKVHEELKVKLDGMIAVENRKAKRVWPH
jgi:hypothetical protein